MLTPQLTAGVVYQTKTDLSDMHTGGATLLLNGGGMTMPVKGSVTVKNFQWPEMYGIGVSYTPDDRWQVVADYRHIGWAAVMKRFQMTFDGGVMGSLNLSLNQDWKDQNVLMLGTAYRYTPQLTLRAGLNVANNPIASSTVNPLFPAIVKSHVSAGLGYQINKGSSVDASVVYAPKVKMQSDFSGTQISHGQTNAQILYSMFF